VDLIRKTERSVRNQSETFFTVNETDYPLRETWPFLLIVRTGRIFTAHAQPYEEGVTRTSTAGYSEFPANSQLHLQNR